MSEEEEILRMKNVGRDSERGGRNDKQESDTCMEKSNKEGIKE